MASFIYNIANQKLQNGQIAPSSINSVRLVLDSYVFDANDTLDDITAIDTLPVARGTVTETNVEFTFDMLDPNIPTTTSETAGWAILCTDFDPVLAIDIGTITTQQMTVRVVYNASGIASGYVGQDTPSWMASIVASVNTDYDSDYTLRLFNRIDALSLYPQAVVSFSATETGFVNGAEHTGLLYQIVYDHNGNDAGNQYTMKLFQRLRNLSLLNGATVFSFNMYDTGQIGGLSDITDIGNNGYYINQVYDATATYEVEAIGVPNLIVTRAVDGLSAEIDCDNLPTGYEIKLFRGEEFRGTKISTTELIDLDAGDLPYTDSGLVAANNYKYYGKFTATGDINATPTTVQGARGQSIILIPNSARIP